MNRSVSIRKNTRSWNTDSIFYFDDQRFRADAEFFKGVEMIVFDCPYKQIGHKGQEVFDIAAGHAYDF